MEIDFNSISKEYDLQSESFQANDRRRRLTIANSEPASQVLRDYIISETNSPLLYPLDNGKWTLIASSKHTWQITADGSADAIHQAKRILIDAATETTI